MRKTRGSLTEGLHVFVLFSFAVAQPLFDLLSRGAEFFVVRRSEPLDLFLLTLFLMVLLPAPVVVAERVVGRWSPRLYRWVHGLVLAGPASLIALQVLKRLGGGPGVVLVGGAVVLGVVFSWGYFLFFPLRMFVTALTPVLVIFPGLFLFFSPVSKVVLAKKEPGLAFPKVRAKAPIVMVIFDELPLLSLLDGQGRIDAIRYPHFAALAREATWFRNTTTVSNSTPFAVPAILTGTYPDPSLLPTASDHPHNLFTLLGGSYNLKVLGTMTHLCPDSLCPPKKKRWVERLGSLGWDVSLLYLHLLLPPDLSSRLPDITEKWGNFRGGRTRAGGSSRKALSRHFWSLMAEDLKKDRLRQFMEFVGEVVLVDRPTLYFLHILLPHAPYHYLPSGKVYSTETSLPGLKGQRYVDDGWAVLQLYQRHLLQVGFVDTLLGKLLARLKRVGLYHRSLIVVTADHGVSFRPGDLRRIPVRTNLPDIALVPLLIKAPYQHKGEISDAYVETIDILPTVADILNLPLPWPVDGRSAFDPFLARRKSRTLVQYSGERLKLDPQVKAWHGALERQLALFGAGTRERLFKVGPYREMVGRSVHEVGIFGERGNVEVEINQRNLFANVDPKSSFIPAHITGRVLGTEEEKPLYLAITVNRVIRAVTRTWTFPVRGERNRWSAVVGERAFRPGRNEVEVFLVEVFKGRPVLVRPAGGPASRNPGSQRLTWEKTQSSMGFER